MSFKKTQTGILSENQSLDKLRKVFQEDHPNSNVVSGAVIEDVQSLVEGTELDIRNYLNLCNLVDTTVLHPQNFYLTTRAKQGGPFFDLLSDREIVRPYTRAIPDLNIAREDSPSNRAGALTSKQANALVFALGPPNIAYAMSHGGLSFGAVDDDTRDTNFLQLVLKVYKEFWEEISQDFNLDDALVRGYGHRKKFSALRQCLVQEYPEFDKENTLFLFDRHLESLERGIAAAEKIRSDTGVSFTDDIFVSSFVFSHNIRSFHTKDSLFSAIETRHKEHSDRLMKLTGIQKVYVPPLMSLLLSRCKDRSDIPDELIKLRSEFSGLRKPETEAARIYTNTSLSMAERLEAIEHLDETREYLVQKIRGASKRKIIFRFWDIVKHLTPTKITSEVVTQFLHGAAELKLRHRVQPYLDLRKQVDSVSEKESSIRRVFGSDIDCESLRMLREASPSFL